MNKNDCPVCGNTLSVGFQPWHSSCRKCAYEKGDLLPTINDASAHEQINEKDRESGLQTLRVNNFKILLERILELKPEGGKLLDVGCAHGWFLETAMENFDVLGIEPDEAVFVKTAAKGLPVRNGYFPEILKDAEKFDVIVFNDVIEHIPMIGMILQACKERLNDNGLLVLNLPSSNGVFYGLSKMFCRIGRIGFFERLWQKGLPSPHVHYFNNINIKTILQNHNLRVVRSGNLPTLTLSGLYTRISYTGNLGTLSKLSIYCLTAVALPILRILPSDIIYTIARKD